MQPEQVLNQIKEFLGKEVWEKFEANCKAERSDTMIEHIESTIEDKKIMAFISRSFMWDRSTEGHEYWFLISDNFQKNFKLK